MLISNIACDKFRIKFKEFTDHPIAVGSYPYADGNVMA
jgi:hypothetical protein